MSWAKNPKALRLMAAAPMCCAPGEVRGRDRDGVDEGASAEQAGERVGQRIADADIVHGRFAREY